jgi:hypothetical protein
LYGLVLYSKTHSPVWRVCTVLYCTVLYCTVLYCTVLYCTVLYCNVMYGNAFEDSLKCGESSKSHFLLPKAADDAVHVLLGA